MQQVSAKAFASAIAVDPGRFPALIPVPRRRAAAPIGRIWVLHRRAVLRLVMAALVSLGIGGIYETRDRLAEMSASLSQLGLRELAHSPLGISQISMTGLAITNERDVLAALHITPETSMVNFDADAARQAIEALPSVASATVRKTYPNHVYIKIMERVPVARWRLNGVYTGNALVLTKFLKEAMGGLRTCVNQHGEVALPLLPQRRQMPRYVVLQPCKVFSQESASTAFARDVSKNDLTIDCDRNFRLKDAVVVVLRNGRKLPGLIVWSKDGKCGIRFDNPLSDDDPLISG